jgi:hypothetical protein
MTIMLIGNKVRAGVWQGNACDGRFLMHLLLSSMGAAQTVGALVLSAFNSLPWHPCHAPTPHARALPHWQADLSHRRAVTTEEGEQFAKVGWGAVSQLSATWWANRLP